MLKFHELPLLEHKTMSKNHIRIIRRNSTTIRVVSNHIIPCDSNHFYIGITIFTVKQVTSPVIITLSTNQLSIYINVE